MKSFRGLLFAMAVLAIATLDARGQEAKQDKIQVALPVERQVAEFVECTGRVNAAASVTIVPRVSGFVIEIPFKEGDLVKVGDVLFKIDARPYEAQFKAAQAQVATDSAHFRLADATYKRFKDLDQRQKGADSDKELDKYKKVAEQAKAKLTLAEASLVSARLNIEWTTVKSPIDGQVGRPLVTRGNLVNQDLTQLTTVVSLDPMHVFFDVDERVYLQMKRTVEDSEMAETGPGTTLKVQMGMANEESYSQEGIISFDIKANPRGKGVMMRAVFANPTLPKGGQMLVPGMFVRLRFIVGPPRGVLLVAPSVVKTAGGAKYVIVVNGNMTEARPIKTGRLQSDGMIVIENGLKKNDRVVVGGKILENIRVNPGQIVQVVMPTNKKGLKLEKEK